MAAQRLTTRIFLSGWLLVLAAVGATATPAPAPSTLRVEGEAFGATVTIRFRSAAGPEAETAARAALDRITSLEEAAARAVDGINAEASEERVVELGDDLLDLFARALSFCTWSGGAHGPLGGNLQAHWRAVAGNPEPPPPPNFAVESASCDRLALDRAAGTVRVAAGSRVDLSGFSAGFAVDRAVETLREHGVEHALVRLGRIQRAVGDGPDPADGSGAVGWSVLLPVFEGYRRPLDEVELHDRSLAVVWRADWAPDRPRFVDQRSGEAPAAPWATVAVTELAVDAQALAVSAMVLGTREGRFRMAGLDPEPSVLWLLGTGEGRPLMLDLNWSALRKP